MGSLGLPVLLADAGPIQLVHWLLFAAFVIVMLTLDLTVFH